jgi:hypothetical protein
MTTTARSLLRALLIENMADCSTVDGHDLGSGEMNIFILRMIHTPRSHM